MGQKSSKLQVAEEFLKPRGLYQCSDVDIKKLRKLILDGKLAPCYCPSEADGERCEELEECPICFMGYPALNRSQCCGKEICTECFLQVKLPNGARVGSLCPFCKAEFSVFFRGPRSLAEKEAVQAEEQLILEATLRARQAQEKESEERAVKRLMEKFEKSEREREAAESAALRAAALQAAAEDYNAARRNPPAMQGPRSSVAAEAVGGGMFAVDLAEFIPPDVMSGSAVLDLDDAMLIQAIQASLRDQGAPASEQFDHLIGSPVQPAALAFSPSPLEPAWTSRLEGRDAASPDSSMPAPGQPSCEGQEESGPSGQSVRDAAFWEEVALGPEVSPSPSAPSPQMDARSGGFDASSSSQEARISQATAQISPAWGRNLGEAGDLGSPRRGVVAKSQEDEAARTPSPFPSRRRRSLDGIQGGDRASNTPHQIPDAVLGSDLFTGAADGRTPPRFAAHQPGRSGHSVAMNVMSTVSSTSMEQLLLSARDWDDLLATPKALEALDLLSSQNAATSSSLDMFATHNLSDLLATPTARVLAFPEAIAEAAPVAGEGMQQRNSRQGLHEALPASNDVPPRLMDTMIATGYVRAAGEGCMSAGAAAMAEPVAGGGNGAAHSSDAVAGVAEVEPSNNGSPKAMQSSGPEQVAHGRAASPGGSPLDPRMAPSASTPASLAMNPIPDLGVSPTAEEACRRDGGMGGNLQDPCAAGCQKPELPPCEEAAVRIPEAAVTASRPAHKLDQPHRAPVVEPTEAAAENKQGGSDGGQPTGTSHAPLQDDPLSSMGERSSTASMDSSQQAALEEMETAEGINSSLAAILLRRTSDSDCSAASISPREHFLRLMPNPASQARMSRIADPVDSSNDPRADLSPDRFPGKSAGRAPVPGDGSSWGADEEPLARDSNGSNGDTTSLLGRCAACSGELQDILSRNGSGQECEGLIAAVRVPSPNPSPQQKALPAPPRHLKALISSSEKAPQGMQASQEAAVRASSPFQPRISSPITPPGKALSFADLVAGKSRTGVGSTRKSKAPTRSPIGGNETITVGMMMVTRDPAAAAGLEDQTHQAKPAGAAGTAEAKQSSSELPIAGSNAHKKPSRESQPGGCRGTLLYREPCSSGGMHLSEDGGAVLLTNPDGSSQLVLLTNDQRKQVAAAQAWKVEPPTLESYTAPSTPEDLAVKQRIAAADEAMLALYRRLQANQASGTSPSAGNAQPQISQNATASQGEDFMDRLRKADEAFAQALTRRDAETGAAGPRTAAERPVGDSQDAADASLTKLLDEEDAKMYRSA